ncbi:MAG: thiamine diphosphokinase [archaeon]
MKTALIVANGSVIDKKRCKGLAAEADIIIAADGGANACLKQGITPTHVIGDFDSITARAKKKYARQLMCVKDQDTTDLQKALSLAQRLKVKKLTVIGATGTRLDHTLANIVFLSRQKIPVHIIDEHNDMHIVQKHIIIEGKRGDLVSIIALADVQGLSCRGLRWSIREHRAAFGWVGVSNRMLGSHATISLKKGSIAVIRARD